MSRNMTITVDEEVARWARIWAAKHNTSVSKLVGELLRQRMMEDEGYAKAMKDYLSRGPVVLSRSGKRPTRDELYDRDGLR